MTHSRENSERRLGFSSNWFDLVVVISLIAVMSFADLTAAASTSYTSFFGGAAWLPTEDLRFKRGDSNYDGIVDISDAITILVELFGAAGGLFCDDAADANDDGGIDVADAVFVLRYLFAGGEGPPAPGTEWGIDGTPEDLFGCRGEARRGEFATAVIPRRCPDVACDPLVSGSPTRPTADEHINALTAWVRGHGGDIMAVWPQDAGSAGGGDDEDFELVVVLTGPSAVSGLLAVNSRLIMAPRGVMAMSIWPYRCPANIWESPDSCEGSPEDQLSGWVGARGGIVYSIKREDAPAGGDPDRVDYRLSLVLSGKGVITELLMVDYWETQPDLRAEVRFPAPVALMKHSMPCGPVWCPPQEPPWASWWLGWCEEHAFDPSICFDTMYDSDALSGWLGAMGPPVYFVWMERFETTGAGPHWASFYSYVLAPPESMAFLEEHGFSSQ